FSSDLLQVPHLLGELRVLVADRIGCALGGFELPLELLAARAQIPQLTPARRVELRRPLAEILQLALKRDDPLLSRRELVPMRHPREHRRCAASVQRRAERGVTSGRGAWSRS